VCLRCTCACAYVIAAGLRDVRPRDRWTVDTLSVRLDAGLMYVRASCHLSVPLSLQGFLFIHLWWSMTKMSSRMPNLRRTGTGQTLCILSAAGTIFQLPRGLSSRSLSRTSLFSPLCNPPIVNETLSVSFQPPSKVNSFPTTPSWSMGGKASSRSSYPKQYP
jgi:hypothetical protein